MTRLHLTIDCHDPDGQAAFWALALGYVPTPPPEGFGSWREWYLDVGVPEEELGDGDCLDRIEDPNEAGPQIWFQPVPEAKSIKNRLHLDIRVTVRSEPVEKRAPLVDAKVTELVAAGATELYRLNETKDHYAVTMQDPEGNEFCVT